MTDIPFGKGPLAGSLPDSERPIDDPALADRADPRWDDPTSPRPDAQPLVNPEGSPNVLPPREMDPAPMRLPGDPDLGTGEDQAARPLADDVGADNLRAGRGGGAANPALAEGGDSG